MSNSKFLSLAVVIAMAAVMITATTIIPTYNAFASNSTAKSIVKSTVKNGGNNNDHKTGTNKPSKDPKTNSNTGGGNNNNDHKTGTNKPSKDPKTNSNTGGGSYHGTSVGETESKSVQKADLSQNVAFGPGATGNTADSTPTNTQTQTTNTGAAVVDKGGSYHGSGNSGTSVGETESKSVQKADLSQNVAFGPGATGNTAD